jgi:hypothetical protein
LSRAKKPALTRRMEYQQQRVLACDAADYHYPWQYITKTTGELHGMCAYLFANRWQGRNIAMHKLQRVVLASGCSKAALLFAKNIKGANVRRLQKVVLDSGTADEKRQFAREIPGADIQWLEAIAAVQDVMEL